MKGKNTAVAAPFVEGDAETSVPSSPDTFRTEILQGVFPSVADRDAFLQAVTAHGVTFLRCANTPLSRPSAEELNSIERLARAVSCLWKHSPACGGEHD